MFKKVILNADNIDISGQLYLPAGKGPYPTVCVCHGIPDRVSSPNDKDYSLLAEKYSAEGLATFIFNFRGTGTSGGNFDLLGWTRDLKAVIDYLSAVPEVDKSRLCLLGFSGGAAVSIYVASQDNRVSCVAACACPAEFTFVNEVDEPQSVVAHFRDIGTIKDKNFPRSAGEWLNGFRQIRPVDYVAGISRRPLLIVHGTADETVDVSHARWLYDIAGEPKQLAILEDAGHRLRQDDRAIAIVIKWLKSQYRK